MVNAHFQNFFGDGLGITRGFTVSKHRLQGLLPKGFLSLFQRVLDDADVEQRGKAAYPSGKRGVGVFCGDELVRQWNAVLMTCFYKLGMGSAGGATLFSGKVIVQLFYGFYVVQKVKVIGEVGHGDWLSIDRVVFNQNGTSIVSTEKAGIELDFCSNFPMLSSIR